MGVLPKITGFHTRNTEPGDILRRRHIGIHMEAAQAKGLSSQKGDGNSFSSLFSPRCSTYRGKQRQNEPKTSYAPGMDKHVVNLAKLRSVRPASTKYGNSTPRGRWASHEGGRASSVNDDAPRSSFKLYRRRTPSLVLKGIVSKMYSLPIYCIAIAQRPGNVSAVVVVRLPAVYRGSILLHCCAGCVLCGLHCCSAVIFSRGCVHTRSLTRKTRSIGYSLYFFTDFRSDFLFCFREFLSDRIFCWN